jgi:general secretion pathway protein G
MVKLINLLTVTSFAVLLATVGTAEYRSNAIHVRELELMRDLFRFRLAIDQFHADKGHYPSTPGALVSEGYLTAIPADPFTGSDSTWRVVPAASGLGVSDLESGSDGTSLALTKYWSW